MKKFIILFSIFILPNFGFAQSVQQSHISANLPDTYEEFLRILDRDLNTYFSAKFGKSVELDIELLRRTPTQSGLSYPKFYGWVNIYSSGEIIDSGAIRIAAIDKTYVKVTDFVSKGKIIEDPIHIESVFPKALCGTIRKRANIIK